MRSRLYVALVLAGCAADAADAVETDTSWGGGKADGVGTSGPLRITEVHAHPDDGNAAFVELMNVSDEPVDLEGCTLSIDRSKLSLVAVSGHDHVMASEQLAVIVEPSRDVTAIPPDAAVATAQHSFASQLAASQKLIVRCAERESDKADAGTGESDDGLTALERDHDDSFKRSAAGTTPGEQNVINAGAITLHFGNPPDDATDPIAQHVADAIDGAQTTIDAAFFQVNNPTLIDAFARAAGRGVKIRFVTDTTYFTDPNYAAGYQRLVTAGIPVVDDKRSALMHSKFMVIDGKAVWTGSYNLIVPDHASYDHADNALFMQSKQLAAIHTEQFEQMFGGAFGPAKHDAAHHDVFVDGVHVEVYFAPTDKLRDHALAAIGKAQAAVHFATFSFYQRDLGTALVTAYQRGIDVRGVFDITSTTGSGSQYPPLVAVGADMRSAAPNSPYLFLHDKFVVIDAGSDAGTILTGSPNFSDSAYGSNDEAMYLVHDRKLSVSYEQTFHVFFDRSVGPNMKN